MRIRLIKRLNGQSGVEGEPQLIDEEQICLLADEQKARKL